MNITRTTTLSFGASLVGSSITLLVYVVTLNAFQRGLLSFLQIAGLLFLAHGTGYLMKGIAQLLRLWRMKHPAIGTINDLSWSAEKRPYAWVSTQMTPEIWKTKLSEEAKQLKIKTKIKLIETNRRWLGYFIDMYNVIVNPYGSVYPEVNIKEHSTWNTLSSYVLTGGTVVSLADIPFYYAFDKIKGIRYDLARRAYHYVPLKYRQNGNLFELNESTLQPISPFSETPFLLETHLEVINTELMQAPVGSPKICTLNIKKPNYQNEMDRIENVSINRAFVVGKNDSDIKFSNLKSIVQELLINDSINCTPLCYINYGSGRYLVSTLFLDGVTQPVHVQNSLLHLLTKLIVQETRRTFMENKVEAQKSANNVSIMADFIAKALSYQYPPQELKVVLNVPLKQLEDEIQSLKAYVNALK